MMTKKDYEAVAEILRDSLRPDGAYGQTVRMDVLSPVVSQLADMFARDNGRFDRGRFESAVYADVRKAQELAEARSLHDIATEIIADWAKPYFGATPYVRAMVTLDRITDNYGQDSADSVVRYFLANAGTWRGETARRVKAELKAMLS